MRTKKEMLEEATREFSDPKFVAWYEKNFTGRSQAETLSDLELGLTAKQITLKQALACAFIVGFQWAEKFEGVR